MKLPTGHRYFTARCCFWLLVCLVASGRPALGEPPMRDPRALERWVNHYGRSERYVPPSAEEQERCEELFARALSNPEDPALNGELRDFGWELLPPARTRTPWWILAEPTRSARGWGLYAFAPERSPGLMLQAPHCFADEFTRNLSLRLMQDGDFAGCAWNTVPRKLVDVAHEHNHPYSAFTRALLAIHPESYVAQLHGYAQEKRTTAAGATADLIISNGDAFPDQWVRKIATLLQAEFPYGSVRLYPLEIRELGATTNVQGEILRQSGSQRFLHLEMSRELRVRLVADREARQLLLKNLDAGVE